MNRDHLKEVAAQMEKRLEQRGNDAVPGSMDALVGGLVLSAVRGVREDFDRGLFEPGDKLRYIREKMAEEDAAEARRGG